MRTGPPSPYPGPKHTRRTKGSPPEQLGFEGDAQIVPFKAALVDRDDLFEASGAAILTAVTGTFAGYELLEEIGRGAAGVVWRARDPRSGEVVALKVVPREVGASPGFLERFRREAAAAAS